MDFREFSRHNRTRCEDPQGFDHKMEDWSASDWMVATFGELGEGANILKKLNRVRDGIPGNKETKEELKAEFARELADTLCYLDLMAQSVGIDLMDEVIKKFDEVSKRIGYPILLTESREED